MLPFGETRNSFVESKQLSAIRRLNSKNNESTTFPTGEEGTKDIGKILFRIFRTKTAIYTARTESHKTGITRVIKVRRGLPADVGYVAAILPNLEVYN